MTRHRAPRRWTRLATWVAVADGVLLIVGVPAALIGQAITPPAPAAAVALPAAEPSEVSGHGGPIGPVPAALPTIVPTDAPVWEPSRGRVIVDGRPLHIPPAPARVTASAPSPDPSPSPSPSPTLPPTVAAADPVAPPSVVVAPPLIGMPDIRPPADPSPPVVTPPDPVVPVVPAPVTSDPPAPPPSTDPTPTSAPAAPTTSEPTP